MAFEQVNTTPLSPPPTSILGNTLTTGTGATLITIPAGRVWWGSVAVEASGTAAAASAAVSIAGTGALPAPGTLLQVDVVDAAGGLGTANANNLTGVYVSAGATAATLTATIVGTGSCSVNGILL
jgi:hypothetical protein